jgi:hypothetical protein
MMELTSRDYTKTTQKEIAVVETAVAAVVNKRVYYYMCTYNYFQMKKYMMVRYYLNAFPNDEKLRAASPCLSMMKGERWK